MFILVVECLLFEECIMKLYRKSLELTRLLVKWENVSSTLRENFITLSNIQTCPKTCWLHTCQSLQAAATMTGGVSVERRRRWRRKGKELFCGFRDSLVGPFYIMFLGPQRRLLCIESDKMSEDKKEKVNSPPWIFVFLILDYSRICFVKDFPCSKFRAVSCW